VEADYLNYLCVSNLFRCYEKTLPVRRLYGVGDRMIDEYEVIGGMRIGKGNGSSLRNPVTLSTTNPTCPDLGSKPGRRDGIPALTF
jgi:hypothetical protein